MSDHEGPADGTPAAMMAAATPPSSADAALAAEEKVEWPSRAEDYELMQPIGEGSTATVLKARCKKNNQMVAIKMIDLDMATADLDEIVNEMLIMRRCHHPNLVSYFTCFEVHDEAGSNKLWIVMKLLEKGSMLSVLRWKEPRSKGGVLDEYIIGTVLKYVIEGLVYLHHQGQIHRDVKAGNILLASDGNVKLADFGVSSWVADDQFSSFEAAQGPRGKKTKKSLRQRSTFVGTPCWMAPEVMLQEPYNEKADVWSVGITALELATGAAPYAKHDPMKVLMLTIDNDSPTLDTCATERGKDFSAFKKPFRKFVALCLQKDPHNRPSAADLLKTDFIKKFAKDEEHIKKNLVDVLPVNFQQPPSEPKKPAVAQADNVSRFSLVKWDFGSLREEERAQLQAAKEGGAAGTAGAAADGDGSTATDAAPATGTAAPAGTGADAGAAAPAADGATAPAADGAATPADGAAATDAEPKPGTYDLRLRIFKGDEQQDIAFPLTYPDETPEGISEELVGEELIRVLDASHVAAAMQSLLLNPSQSVLTFPLYGTKAADDDPRLTDATLSEGFARVFIGELALNPPEITPAAAAASDGEAPAADAADAAPATDTEAAAAPAEGPADPPSEAPAAEAKKPAEAETTVI